MGTTILNQTSWGYRAKREPEDALNRNSGIEQLEYIGLLTEC
jgi:hypothetical protein